MNELDRIFFGQSIAWREGFFYAIAYPRYFDECYDQLSPGKDQTNFKEGWEYATYLRREHNKSLNNV